jgi:hypothetical protein
MKNFMFRCYHHEDELNQQYQDFKNAVEARDAFTAGKTVGETYSLAFDFYL